MRRSTPLLLAALMMLAAAMPALCEQRVALVIGNDRYPSLAADQQLQKAVNDAHAVGKALAALGFDVIFGENLTRQGIVDKLDELVRRLSPGDTAFFFFSGHGVAIGGGNYILPTDVPNIETGQDVRLVRAALGENDIVSDLQQRGVRVAVVVLDACRSNPFKRPGTRAVGAERGLVRTEPVHGVFSLYSAGIGQSALDRLGNSDPNPNSVFTRVLVPALGRPGLHLGDLAIEVREEVARLARSIGHAQRPAYYDETLGGRVYLAGLPQPDNALSALAPARNDPQARMIEVAATVIDAVVKVSSRAGARKPLGSGFIVDASGLIVVANQAVDARDVIVTLMDGTTLEAEIAGRDPRTDLALLKVKSDRPLPAVKLGNSDKLKVGERIITIGHPQGLDSTVMTAVVTGLHRDIGAGPYDDHIQMDVAYKGMGPVFNLDGEVVGIGAAMVNPPAGSAIKLGFAIPSNRAVAVIDQLQQYGTVRRGWLGVRIEALTPEIAESLAITAPRGALVSAVDDKGPAMAAGIERGDVIINVDGTEIRDSKDASYRIASIIPGRQIPVTAIRKGREETRIVTLGVLEEPDRPAAIADFKLAEMSPDLRARFRIKDTVKGAVITEVAQGSDAAKKGLTAGTVILEVAQKAVASGADVEARINEARHLSRKILLLLVASPENELRYVMLPLPQQSAGAPSPRPGSPLASFFREFLDERSTSGSGWLGVKVQTAPDRAGGRGDAKKDKGALVSEVSAEGPAAGAIKPGDMIISVDGARIADASDFSQIIAAAKPETQVKLGLLRNAVEQTLAVKLGKLPLGLERLEALLAKAEGNDADAMHALGNLYLDGDGVAKDEAQARSWDEKAANLGHPAAMSNLGWFYEKGRGGPQDYTEARYWYLKAAEKGEVTAMNNLGLLDAEGRGGPKSYAEARRWFEKAAEKGNVMAMNNLGVLYAEGQGVPKSYVEARRWYEKAAQTGGGGGGAAAMVNLGRLYLYGQGVAKDSAEAKRWFEKGADLGNANAMTDLGAIHHNGQGLARDYAEARRWYEKAAGLGEAGAMFNLGRMYELGQGVGKSSPDARSWYQKAAEKGNQEASRKLQTLR